MLHGIDNRFLNYELDIANSKLESLQKQMESLIGAHADLIAEKDARMEELTEYNKDLRAEIDNLIGLSGDT